MDSESMVLCYVDDGLAWFTSCPLDKQWGDDWDDAPYEHNASTPYAWRDYMAEHGTPRYDLFSVYYAGPFVTPDADVCNSPYSVQTINRGDIAWLRPCKYAAPKHAKSIRAGTTYADFRRIVEDAGGCVSRPQEPRP